MPSALGPDGKHPSHRGIGWLRFLLGIGEGGKGRSEGSGAGASGETDRQCIGPPATDS